MDDVLSIIHKKIFCSATSEIAPDSRYYDSDNEKLAYDARVKNVCISKVGKKTKIRAQLEDTSTFKCQRTLIKNKVFIKTDFISLNN